MHYFLGVHQGLPKQNLDSAEVMSADLQSSLGMDAEQNTHHSKQVVCRFQMVTQPSPRGLTQLVHYLLASLKYIKMIKRCHVNKVCYTLSNAVSVVYSCKN